jgi:hypothetical protein
MHSWRSYPGMNVLRSGYPGRADLGWRADCGLVIREEKETGSKHACDGVAALCGVCSGVF